MIVSVELTEKQVRDVVRRFVGGIGRTDLKWLLNEIVQGNFHTLDHNATVHMLRKIVNRECHLEEKND